jgi:hypothetical protein
VRYPIDIRSPYEVIAAAWSERRSNPGGAFSFGFLFAFGSFTFVSVLAGVLLFSLPRPLLQARQPPQRDSISARHTTNVTSISAQHTTDGASNWATSIPCWDVIDGAIL